MPKINKNKVVKSTKKAQSQAKSKTKAKPTQAKKPTQSRIKHSVAYYDCCAKETKKGLKGVKITSICHHCKHNSQKYAIAKAQDREVEKRKIAQAWKQIGLSLSKIIE